MPAIELTKAELKAIAFCVLFGRANEGEDPHEDRMFRKASAAMERLFGPDWDSKTGN